MTVSTTTAKVTVLGNGVQTTFNYGFQIPAQSQAVLYITTGNTGVTAALPSSVWTMTGAGSPTGGTFTYPIGGGTPLATGDKLTLLRGIPQQQTTNLINQGSYYPQSVESALDTMMEIIQQIQERSNRTVHVSVSEMSGGPDLPTAAVRASRGLGFDGSGNFALIDYSNASSDLVTPDGGTESFTLGDLFSWWVRPEWWGAMADGVTDDTAAIQAAINSVIATGGVVLFRARTYRHTGLVMVNGRSVTLQGAGRSTYIAPSPSNAGTVLYYDGVNNGDWVKIDGDQCGVQDMELTKNPALTLVSGVAVNFTDSGSNGTRCFALRLVIHYPRVAIKQAGLPACIFSDIIAYGYTGKAGFWWFGDTSLRSDNLFMTRITMQADNANVAGAGFLFEGNIASGFATDCYSTGGLYGYWFQATGTGEYPGATRFLRCAAEAAKAHGYYLQKCRAVTIMDSFVGGNGLAVNGFTGHGIYVVDVTGVVTLDTLDVRTNGEHGIRVWPTATYVNIVNPQVAANSQNSWGTDSGIFFENGCDGFSVVGGRSGGDIFYNPAGVLTQKWGIGISNGCTNFTVLGVNVLGNLTAGIIDSSTDTGSTIRHNIGHTSGANADTAVGVTPNGSGNVFITHGLHKVPIYANCVLVGDNGSKTVATQSVTSTQIVARVYDAATGADVTAGTFDIMWEARSIRQ